MIPPDKTRLGILCLGVLPTVALLYALGRLKLLYYYRTFGVDPGGLELTFQDYLFESWFTAQNVLFFLVLWWVVAKTRSLWLASVGIAYSLIPIASHYAFEFGQGWPSSLLIDYRHTLLKLVPFAVLAGVWLFRPSQRPALRELTWRLPRAGRVLFALVTLAWAISSAKHFGSFDANRAIRDPERFLVRVQLGPGVDPSIRETSARDDLYLLHSNRLQLVLWDRTGFRYGTSSQIRTLVVPRSAVDWVESRKRFEIQPGSQFL